MALKPEYTICLDCGIGELRPDPFLVRCSECDYVLSRSLFVVLRQIRTLPEAAGRDPKDGDRKSGERRRREKR